MGEEVCPEFYLLPHCTPIPLVFFTILALRRVTFIHEINPVKFTMITITFTYGQHCGETWHVKGHGRVTTTTYVFCLYSRGR